MNNFNPNVNRSWAIGVGTDTFGAASAGATQNLIWGVMGADEAIGADPDAKLMFTFRTDVDAPLANAAGDLVGAATSLRTDVWSANITATNGDRLNERSTHNAPGNGQNSFKYSDLPAANAASWFDSLSFYMSNIAGLAIQNPAEQTMGSLNDQLMTVILSWSGTGTTVDTSANHPGRWSLSLGSTSGTLNYTATPAPVPVPAAAWLLGSGLLAMFGARRRG